MKGCISNEEAEKLIDPGFLKEYRDGKKEEEKIIVYPTDENTREKLIDWLSENDYEWVDGNFEDFRNRIKNGALEMR